MRRTLEILRVAAVLAVGIPIVSAQFLYYGLRKVIFGIPFNGEWCMDDVRRRLHGQPSTQLVRKGPNTWN